MNEAPIIDMFPAKTRRVSYIGGSLLGLALPATAVGFVAAEHPLPTWLIVGMAVYGFVAGPLFGLAARNVNK